LADAVGDYVPSGELGRELVEEGRDVNFSDNSEAEQDYSLVYDQGSDSDGDETSKAPFPASMARAVQEAHLGFYSLVNERDENRDQCMKLPPPSPFQALRSDPAPLTLPPPSGQAQAESQLQTSQKRRDKLPRKRPSKSARNKRKPRGMPSVNHINTEKKRRKQLTKRNQQRCEHIHRAGFSISTSTHPVSTGWHGKQESQYSQKMLHRAWRDGSIMDEISTMRFVPYTYDARCVSHALFSSYQICRHNQVDDLEGLPSLMQMG
jgi:hypothetical protein